MYNVIKPETGLYLTRAVGLVRADYASLSQVDREWLIYDNKKIDHYETIGVYEDFEHFYDRGRLLIPGSYGRGRWIYHTDCQLIDYAERKYFLQQKKNYWSDNVDSYILRDSDTHEIINPDTFIDWARTYQKDLYINDFRCGPIAGVYKRSTGYWHRRTNNWGEKRAALDEQLHDPEQPVHFRAKRNFNNLANSWDLERSQYPLRNWKEQRKHQWKDK